MKEKIVQKDIFTFYKNKYENISEVLYGKDTTEIKRWQIETDWKAKHLLSVIPNQLQFNNILEIGCATGLVLSKVSKKLGVGMILGIDISNTNVRIAQKEIPHGIFMTGVAEYMPFKDNSIDLVILSDILEHIKDPKSLLKEAKRVSKYVVLNIPLEKCLKNMILKKNYGLEHIEGHLHAWNKKEILSILNDVGLTVAEYELISLPDAIRWYSMKYYPEWFRKSKFKPFLISLEKFMHIHLKSVYLVIFEKHAFVFCKC